LDWCVTCPALPAVPAGVLRASRMRINPRQRSLHSLFKTYLDVLHFGKDDTMRMFG
jgi:hypothetical protein